MHARIAVLGPVLAAGALAALAPAAAAAAKPKPVQVAADARASGTPSIVVDATGATGIAWATSGLTGNRIRFALKPRGRALGRPVTLPLPPGTTTVFTPLIYQAVRGEWRIVMAAQSGNVQSEWVARSTNGRTWSFTKIPDAGGQPVWFAGRSGSIAADASGIYGLMGTIGAEELVRVAPDLRSATRTPFLTQVIGGPRVVRAGDGTIFAIGGGTGGAAFQVGATPGAIPVPGCDGAGSVTGTGMPTGIVVALIACGNAYATTISRTGAVGPLRRLGPAAEFVEMPGVQRGPGGLVAAWIAPDGDIRLARSASGATWRVSAGQIPSSRLGPGSTVTGAIAGNGTVAYLLGSPAPRSVWMAVDGARVGQARISTRGLPRAKVSRVGTAAIAVSRSITFASLRRTSKLTFRLAASVAEPLNVYVTASGDSAGALSIGSVLQRVKAGATRTVTVPVRLSDLRVFGTGRGDTFTLSMSGRNGRVETTIKLT